jgi:hypothetical protein
VAEHLDRVLIFADGRVRAIIRTPQMTEPLIRVTHRPLHGKCPEKSVRATTVERDAFM